MTDIPHLFPGTKLELAAEAFMTPFLGHNFTVVDVENWGKSTHFDLSNNYWHLSVVLCAAYAQAAVGKGKERHAQGDVFLDQPIITIGQLLKSPDGEAYQAIKKVREGLMMHRTGESERCIREILGAINYLAATAILVAEESHNRGIREFEEQQRVFEPDYISDAVAAAEITTAELDTIMGLRRGECSVVTAGSIVPLPASAISPPEPSYAEFEVECPHYSVGANKDQFLYALLKYGPSNTPSFGVADHLGAHDAMSRLEFFRLMAEEAAQIQKGKPLPYSQLTDSYKITCEALDKWRKATYEAVK